ncbi:hypothetical protein NDU88_001709 [Pleurodeles waltl]|uniref:Uncharacterized protein n=1 Tax=Pleurodeles waltl TaxID=8319 RepID=A0AAV7U777_PLEWA|nr:hypothetical protein NDU88_001709 [Pleurodeles waltl]
MLQPGQLRQFLQGVGPPSLCAQVPAGRNQFLPPRSHRERRPASISESRLRCGFPVPRVLTDTAAVFSLWSALRSARTLSYVLEVLGVLPQEQRLVTAGLYAIRSQGQLGLSAASRVSVGPVLVAQLCYLPLGFSPASLLFVWRR